MAGGGEGGSLEFECGRNDLHTKADPGVIRKTEDAPNQPVQERSTE